MVASITQLEQQLLSIQEGAMMNEKYGVEAEEEIESYFARCEQALAARKVTLMRELAEQLINQSMLSPLLFSLCFSSSLFSLLFSSSSCLLLFSLLFSSPQSLSL